MLQKNLIKYIVFLICIFLLNINTVNSQLRELSIENDITTKTMAFFDIDITEVSDGLGLDITIKNNGDSGIDYLILEVDVDDRTVILSRNQFEIMDFEAGESKVIHVTIFGFNIGYLRDYSKISILVKNDETIFIEGVISCSIIGPYISIITRYFNDEDDFEGYILFCPMWSTTTYLINKQGDVVHSWQNTIYQDSQSTYLLENGNLVRASLVATSSFPAGGYQGRVEIFDWNDTKIWSYEHSTQDYCSHHDIQPLPNGNILLISWERFTRQEAINAGKNPNIFQDDYIWSDYIVEIQPKGESEAIIVWEWHAWDHLVQDYDESKDNYGVIKENPGLIDINFGSRRNDWLHTNSIDYNPDLDQILLSVHNFNEIWIIDHSTTTEEAANHTGGRYDKGGDLLYRWGNPAAYDLGTNSDQQYFGQHGATWIKSFYPREGNILIFNNEAGNSNRYSTANEIIPPINEDDSYISNKNQSYGPEEQSWIFSTPNPQDMYSRTTSNVQGLPNGNVLICSANQGYFLEVTYDKQIIWEFRNPYPLGFANKGVARIQWYSEDYPGLRNLFD